MAPVVANLGPLEDLALTPNADEVGSTRGQHPPSWVTAVTPRHGGVIQPLTTLCRQVEEVFTLPLAHLLREENQGYTHFRGSSGRYGYTLPVFLNGPHRVWGLTAIITELTLELLAPDRYRRKTYVPAASPSPRTPQGTSA